MDFEDISGNCISFISEYIPDYISFALVSRQFRDSWVGEKKTNIKLLKKYVENGNLEMVKFYIKNGFRWDEYAKSEGCPRNISICIYSAINGHLEMLVDKIPRMSMGLKIVWNKIKNILKSRFEIRLEYF